MSKQMNAIVTALGSGATTGLATYFSQPGRISWTHVVNLTVVGAIVGVVNWLRDPPPKPGL